MNTSKDNKPMRADAEEQSRTPQFLEVAEVAVPVWLRDDGYTIACRLEHSSDNSRPKRRMVDIGVAREQDDIQFIPSPEFQFLLRRRQEVRQSIILN